MIYMHVTLQIAPEKFEEYKKVFSDEYLAPGAKSGRKFIGAWETMIGTHRPKEVTVLWAFDDLAHMQRAQEAMAKDEELKRARMKFNSTTSGETVKLIVPLPYSPLK